MIEHSTSNSSVKIGEKVEDFTLLDDEGKAFHLYKHLGTKNLVLFFYPKDDTPGCIKEVCFFRDEYEVFNDLNAQIVGVSNDDKESHTKFKTKYALPFKLLSDEKNRVRQLFKVKSNLFGLLPGRVTFIIDKTGILQYVFDSHLNIKKHVDESIRILKELN